LKAIGVLIDQKKKNKQGEDRSKQREEGRERGMNGVITNIKHDLNTAKGKNQGIRILSVELGGEEK